MYIDALYELVSLYWLQSAIYCQLSTIYLVDMII